MKDCLRSLLLGLALAAASAAAAAQQLALTAKNVNVRAGPDRFYPVVAVLPPGTQVVVQGCLADYRWCDVTFGGQRGWVYAGNLSAAWQGVITPLPPVAPGLGIVIAPFVFESYWGLHYRHRPWYPERHRWVRPPPRTVVPPGHVRPPPGGHPLPGVHAVPPGRPAPPHGDAHPGRGEPHDRRAR